MSISAERQLGYGIIVPLITPLNTDGSIDTSGLRRLVDHVIKGGVDAVFIMGSTGEFPRFSREEWVRAVGVAVKHTDGRVPVYAGVSDARWQEVALRLEMGFDLGIDAAVLSPMYYFPLNQDEICRFYEKVGAKSPGPLFLYSIPPYTQARIEPHSVRKIGDVIPLAGIKDSGDDLETFRLYLEVAKELEGFKVAVGNESMLEEAFRLGASGAVPSLANVFPRLLADVFGASRRADWNEVSSLCTKIEHINHLNGIVDSSMNVVAWKKYALSLLGICGATMTHPGVSYDGKTLEKIKGHLAENGLALPL